MHMSHVFWTLLVYLPARLLWFGNDRELSTYVYHTYFSRFYVNNGIQFSVCPNGTYWHSWNLCKPCSDINHITSEFPALNSSHCVCKSGFKADQHNRCEILRCPMLQPPENGYFVKHPLGCDRVLNTACGARCKSGYQLIGSSIRLCQDNGTWSGVQAKCVCKYSKGNVKIICLIMN